MFNTMHEAVAETGANTAMVFVPPPFAADAIYEAADAGIGTIICITEGIPAHDMLRVYNSPEGHGSRLIGPNCPGVLVAGQGQRGHHPGGRSLPRRCRAAFALRKRSPTRSATSWLSSESELTIVGIGGDPVIGCSFIDVIASLQADPETELIVMVGEIGGDEEERNRRLHRRARDQAGRGLHRRGFEAPPGKRMGHAGAIISGSSERRRQRRRRWKSKGVQVGRNPTEVAQLAAEQVKAKAEPRVRRSRFESLPSVDGLPQHPSPSPVARRAPTSCPPRSCVPRPTGASERSRPARSPTGAGSGYGPLRDWIARAPRRRPRARDGHQRLARGGMMLFDHARRARATRWSSRRPSYDRTLLGAARARRRAAGDPAARTTASTSAALEAALSGGAEPSFIAHDPQLPQPGRLHAVASQARAAAGAGGRVRLPDLRGRPLPRGALRGRGPADDAVARQRRPRRLRVLVLEDDRARRAHRLPDRRRRT